MRRFIFFALYLTALYAYGLPWDRPKLLSCDSSDDALLCNSQCKPTNRSIDYKINDKNSVVISTMYEADKLISSQSYDKCQIVDEKNWKCSSISISEGRETQVSMINGNSIIKEFYPLKMKTFYRCSK